MGSHTAKPQRDETDVVDGPSTLGSGDDGGARGLGVALATRGVGHMLVGQLAPHAVAGNNEPVHVGCDIRHGDLRVGNEQPRTGGGPRVVLLGHVVPDATADADAVGHDSELAVAVLHRAAGTKDASAFVVAVGLVVLGQGSGVVAVAHHNRAAVPDVAHEQLVVDEQAHAHARAGPVATLACLAAEASVQAPHGFHQRRLHDLLERHLGSHAVVVAP